MYLFYHGCDYGMVLMVLMVELMVELIVELMLEMAVVRVLPVRCWCMEVVVVGCWCCCWFWFSLVVDGA